MGSLGMIILIIFIPQANPVLQGAALAGLSGLLARPGTDTSCCSHSLRCLTEPGAEKAVECWGFGMSVLRARFGAPCALQLVLK